jgi:hypothetical protein
MGTPATGAAARYPDIADHGLIGDLQTAALVATDGTVDWFCCPRFDSPSVFASLLDADHGGHFRVGPDRDDYVTRQLYVPDTAILITRFLTPDGVGEVHDFMPVADGRATRRHRLIRQLLVVRGTMRFVTDIQPRFDYARQPHTLELSQDGAVFRAESLELTLHMVGRRGTSLQDEGITMERQGDGVHLTRVLREGQSAGFVLESTGGPARRITPGELERLRTETAQAGLSRHPPPGCPSRSAANGTGTTGTPGSGMARSPSTRCSAWASPKRPRPLPAGCGTGSARSPATTRRR